MNPQSEHDIQNLIRIGLSEDPSVRTFRNNVAGAYTGELVSFKNGVVILRNARPLKAGLFVGSSDLIGWVTTESAAGPRARFLSLEVKTPAGHVTEEQAHWIATVRQAGGIAGAVRSLDEARDLILRS